MDEKELYFNDSEPLPTYNESASGNQTGYPPDLKAETHSEEEGDGLSSVPKFASLTLKSWDRVSLTDFPQEVITSLDRAILQKWEKGIQRATWGDGGWYWKLNGKPWFSLSEPPKDSRMLLLGILTSLSELGYELHASFVTTISKFDRDTLFFRHAPKAPLPDVGTSHTNHKLGFASDFQNQSNGRTFFLISFAGSDILKLTSCPNESVLDAMNTAISTWPGGIEDNKEKDTGDYRWKLKGTPWRCHSGDHVSHSRSLLCSILSHLETVGWEMKCSIGMTDRDELRNVDTLVFSDIQR